MSNTSSNGVCWALIIFLCVSCYVCFNLSSYIKPKKVNNSYLGGISFSDDFTSSEEMSRGAGTGRTFLATENSSFASICPDVGSNTYWNHWTNGKFKKKLKEYTNFHSQKLELIQNGTLSASEVRTLTWSCPDGLSCAGVGDQLHRIEVAFLLAVISNRVFGIYWNPVAMETMKYLEPHAIRWDLVRPSVGKTPSEFAGETLETYKEYTHLKNVLYSDNSIHLTLTLETSVTLSKVVSFLCEEDKNTMKLFHEIGVLKTASKLGYYAPINVLKSVIFHYLFTFQSQLVSEVNQIQSREGLTPLYVGVYIRTRELNHMLSENKIRPNRSMWSSSIKCSVNFANLMLGNNSLVFLTTDAYEVKKMAKMMYPGRIRTMNNTMKKLKENPTYVVSQEHHNNSITVPYRSLIQNQQTAGGKLGIWIDFVLLARSHGMTCTNDRFSALASSICLIPSSKVLIMPHCVLNSH